MDKRRLEKDLDEKGLPIRGGVYLVKGAFGDKERQIEIDVYKHPIKRLCCFSENFGGDCSSEGVDDETDCHVPVHTIIGLEFISRERDLE